MDMRTECTPPSNLGGDGGRLLWPKLNARKWSCDVASLSRLGCLCGDAQAEGAIIAGDIHFGVDLTLFIVEKATISG
jgi:hypothetical protein